MVVWGGLPFHRAAFTNLRHGAATMDTLVSVGTLAAFGWSLWALFRGHAGMPGMRHGFALSAMRDSTVSRTAGSSTIYLEVAAGVVAFILLGRYLEARSKRRAGAALKALLKLGTVERFENLPGKGVRGRVEGYDVQVGRILDRPLPGPPQRAKETAENEGHTAVVVTRDGVALGVVTVADALKETSAEAVRRLRALGLTPVLLTGDNARVARSVATAVGISPEHVIAEVLPRDKVDVVRRLQGEGRTVAMVGDGVNDAAALATADLGLALGTGTDAAIEAGDLTLVRGDLRVAADAIRLSRRTLATIKGNLAWAFGYNLAALPLAAAGLLNPMIAGAAMALSSVFAVTNSLRLRAFS